jgi:hypothetical protein
MAADWLALSSFALRLVRFAFAALAMDGSPDKPICNRHQVTLPVAPGIGDYAGNGGEG